jgi:hypothetical protein
VRLDRDQLQLHLIWGAPALLVALVCVGWHTSASLISGTSQGGGSPAGLACGVVAGLIILFEMLLWPRKALRRFRIILPTKHWMAAHIWFGLACLPIAWAHCGYHWGGHFTTILMVILLLVIVSGAYGLLMQNVIPRWMLKNLPAETITSQIDYVSQQSVADLRMLLNTACGPPSGATTLGDSTRLGGSARQASGWNPQQGEPEGQAVIVGAVREIGRVRGRTLRTAAVVSSREDADLLWNAFLEIEPFLLQGGKAGGPVHDPTRMRPWFDLLLKSCHESSNDIIMAFQSACDQRHQFDAQRKAHWWLHGWIPIHLGLSVALSVLLIVHVVAALRYW